MSTKRKIGKKQNENVFTLFLTNILLVIISIIAFLHSYTGFLGELLYRSTKTLFGCLWPLFFIVLLLVAVYHLFEKKVRNLVNGKRLLAAILLLVSTGLVVCILFYGNSISPTETMKHFFDNISAIYLQQQNNYAGLIFTVLYGLIYLFAGYVGAIIVTIVFIICSLVLLFYDTNKKIENKIIVNKHNESQQPKAKDFLDFKVFKKKENKQKVEEEKKVEDVKPQSEPSVSLTIDQQLKNKSNYTLPNLTLLENYKITKKSNENQQYANEKWALLTDVLNSFSLPSKLVGCNIGPSVTQYEIVPMENFDIKKYFKIQDNIKMALAIKDVRIQAPIPGKKAIGIEIPNQQRSMVRLKEMLDHIDSKYKNNPLVMALGKDLTGNYVFAPIDKMPHLLIAGSTGSGKSVCINSIILSILFRALPSQVQLILIDPKKVEFTPYAKIPHLACPVVNDTTKAAATLKKLVEVMEERYTKFSENSVRNIEEYNHKNPNNKMSSIVCIIDEMADLMFTHRNEVETNIQRLAAMARASGIYLILATQRPSTDVITGVIKANIPSRIAFAVASPYDSRTIIDKVGAENLLGNGDMLFAPIYDPILTRIQGVYVSDLEINKVVNYLTESVSDTDNNFIEKFLVDLNDENDDDTAASTYSDPAYESVKKYVMTQQTISVSGLQRRFSFGFPRAAKLIDCLQQDGIISESKGSKPREVLIRSNESEK